MNEKWDLRFLDLAEFYSTWSKDPSTQFGGVIVRPDRSVVSLGYNGFARGIADTERRLNNRELKYSLVIHCEMNAVLNAHGPVNGCTLYIYPFLTCDRCSVHMIQAGIITVIAPAIPDDPELRKRWEGPILRAKANYKEARVFVKEYDRTSKGYREL